MSFLKISDPVSNSKRIFGIIYSQRDPANNNYKPIFQFYRPITETQKATTKEITEGLRPIKEGIENLPQAITFPPTQPIGEASREEKEDEEVELVGEIAKEYLNKPNPDKTFGVRKIGGKRMLLFIKTIL